MSTDPIATERLFESRNHRQMTLEADEAVYRAMDRPASGLSRGSWLLAAIFRTFGGTFLFTVFFVAFCYFAVVTVVNPHRVFWGRTFPEIMPNTRALKLELLQEYNRAGTVNLVVLGSSRSTKLSPDLLQSLTGERAFNAGVFSAAPNDFLGLYRVMKQEGTVPKTLVIGLDAEALDPATVPAPDFDSNLTLKSAVTGSVPNLPATIWHWGWLYKETLTPYYAQDIFKSVWIRFQPRPPLFTFDANGQEEDRVMDGQIQSGVYPLAEKVKTCENAERAKFANFQEVSPNLENDLKQLLSEAAYDNARVVLWITPVHPGALKQILEDPQAGRNFRNAESHLVQLGAMFHLSVRDLVDSRSFEGRPDSWYDCVHYSQQDANRITAELFKHGL